MRKLDTFEKVVFTTSFVVILILFIVLGWHVYYVTGNKLAGMLASVCMITFFAPDIVETFDDLKTRW